MHNHGTSESAERCSRFCLAIFRDKSYYQRHHHLMEVGPVTGCFQCKEDKRRLEEKRG